MNAERGVNNLGEMDVKGKSSEEEDEARTKDEEGASGHNLISVWVPSSTSPHCSGRGRAEDNGDDDSPINIQQRLRRRVAWSLEGCNGGFYE